MTGRTRIGLIVPASNTTFESDFASVVPPDVTIHAHRIVYPSSYKFECEEGIDQMNSNLGQASRILSQARVRAIAYGFTTGTFYRGIKYSEDLLNTIEKESGAKAILPSLAILEALNFFRAKKISIATPYPAWNNSVLLKYLGETDIDVLNLEGDNRPSEAAIKTPMWDQDPESIIAFAVKSCHADADLLLCPCTAWRSFEVVGEIEDKLGIPVVTANQATIWKTFRELDIKREINDHGKLLKT